MGFVTSLPHPLEQLDLQYQSEHLLLLDVRKIYLELNHMWFSFHAHLCEFLLNLECKET